MDLSSCLMIPSGGINGLIEVPVDSVRRLNGLIEEPADSAGVNGLIDVPVDMRSGTGGFIKVCFSMEDLFV